jgi:GT2 family glycosyltransferase
MGSGHGQGSERTTPPARRISVIVPHYQDLASLDLCLSALQAQTLAHDEIVVADNASPVGPEAVKKAIAGRARLVMVAEKGAGPARNGGAAAATGDVLAFTDCDCQPEPDWLRRGVEALDQWDLVGGRMVVLVDDPEHMTPTEAFEAVFAFNNERYIHRKGFTVTANLLCRREVFQAVGGFGVRVSEDVEWCRRAAGKGFKLGYAAEAVVGHPARRTWPDLLAKWRRTNREGFLLSASKPLGVARFVARSLLLPASILVHAPVILRSRALKRYEDKRGALTILIRLRMWRLVNSLQLALNQKTTSGG